MLHGSYARGGHHCCVMRAIIRLPWYSDDLCTLEYRVPVGFPFDSHPENQHSIKPLAASAKPTVDLNMEARDTSVAWEPLDALSQGIAVVTSGVVKGDVKLAYSLEANPLTLMNIRGAEEVRRRTVEKVQRRPKDDGSAMYCLVVAARRIRDLPINHDEGPLEDAVSYRAISAKNIAILWSTNILEAWWS
ncbi:hypothetical protein ARMGADRAFT_1057213 [Armillaria gallica]|uniref:Uncharacterized protein n=1 Tax=Armillaria gallica TaxID=47427 RepID=A0A2H3EMS0_ARMGA|nr:hypothetical protein ARMGADRAFT_1057213 [Armillaria gallica]